MKQTSPDTKLIILANVNEKLSRWTFTFRHQQIWGEVLVLIQASSADPFWAQQWKNMKIGLFLPKLS